jgi:hypothetical protein
VPYFLESTVPKIIDRINLPRTNPLNIAERAKVPADVDEFVPRPREGGAFVKFKLPPDGTPTAVEDALRKYLKESPVKPWWSPFDHTRARLVKGKPWVEDLYRVPSPRVKVEFLPTEPGGPAAELSQENLYELFRLYGKLVDITPQPQDSKVLPRYALLDFMGPAPATMAKNCMHGYLVSEQSGGGKTGTMLRLSYEAKIKTNWIREWIVNHPRIVLPIIAALVAGLTVAIFDPVRTFFVKAHIKHYLDFSDSRFVRWARSQADIFRRKKSADENSMSIIWDDRRSNIQEIQGWLVESNETFVIIQGPRGSGKRELIVDQALGKRKNKLIIDCKAIVDAHGESPTICALADQVGYRPVFSFMNTVSGWIDLAAQGATGMKVGFSETLESQVAKILNNTGAALKQIALESRHKNDPDAKLTDDEYLEVHPENRPVVVVDNFLHKSQDREIIYDKIAEW